MALAAFAAHAADTIEVGVVHSHSRAMAIVLVEECFERACDLCDSFAPTDRWQIVLAGDKASMVESDAGRHVSV